MPKEFRFGVSVRNAESQAQVAATARRAEDLGYNVIVVPTTSGLPHRSRR